MGNIELNIALEDSILERVRIETAYAGKKDSPDGASFEQIGALDTDSGVLETYWGDAVSEVISTLRDKYVSLEDGVLTLRMSFAWQEGMLDSLQDSVREFIVAYIVARWMRLVKNGEESKYANDSVSALMKVRELAYHKGKPARPQTD